MKIVFTGPAKVEGFRIVRRDLIEMAERAGWQVQGMVARNDARMDLVTKKLVEPQEAYLKAVDKPGFEGR